MKFVYASMLLFIAVVGISTLRAGNAIPVLIVEHRPLHNPQGFVIGSVAWDRQLSGRLTRVARQASAALRPDALPGARDRAINESNIFFLLLINDLVTFKSHYDRVDNGELDALYDALRGYVLSTLCAIETACGPLQAVVGPNKLGRYYKSIQELIDIDADMV